MTKDYILTTIQSYDPATAAGLLEQVHKEELQQAWRLAVGDGSPLIKTSASVIVVSEGCQLKAYRSLSSFCEQNPEYKFNTLYNYIGRSGKNCFDKKGIRIQRVDVQG